MAGAEEEYSRMISAKDAVVWINDGTMQVMETSFMELGSALL
jgi:hypothetical protein